LKKSSVLLRSRTSIIKAQQGPLGLYIRSTSLVTRLYPVRFLFLPSFVFSRELSPSTTELRRPPPVRRRFASRDRCEPEPEGGSPGHATVLQRRDRRRCSLVSAERVLLRLLCHSASGCGRRHFSCYTPSPAVRAAADAFVAHLTAPPPDVLPSAGAPG
jgi:hypothetical protein